MLREVICKHIKPRIVPFSYTTTASSASLSVGAGDLTVGRTGTAAVTLTAREPFSRTGFIFCTPGSPATAGSYTRYSGDPSSKSAWSVDTLPEQGGSSVEGTVDGFLMGFDSTDLSFCQSQTVKSTLTSPRTIWGKITGSTGAVAIGTRTFTCTKASTGVYTIKFTPAFGITPVVLATGISSTVGVNCVVSAKSATGCTISTTPASGVATDADFYLVVMGQDSRHDGGKNRSPLRNNQRDPRIVACDVNNTGGVYSLTVGGATGGADFTTLTDTAAGDFSITIASPFKREPAIIVMASSLRPAVSYSNSVIRVQVRNGTGTLSDTNGPIYVFVIGSDDASEY